MTDSTSTQHDELTVLDATGLLCPEPVMLLHKTINTLPAKSRIRMIATDPSTERDVTKFCHFLGHELISFEKTADEYFEFMIQKL